MAAEFTESSSDDIGYLRALFAHRDEVALLGFPRLYVPTLCRLSIVSYVSAVEGWLEAKGGLFPILRDLREKMKFAYVNLSDPGETPPLARGLLDVGEGHMIEESAAIDFADMVQLRHVIVHQDWTDMKGNKERKNILRSRGWPDDVNSFTEENCERIVFAGDAAVSVIGAYLAREQGGDPT